MTPNSDDASCSCVLFPFQCCPAGPIHQGRYGTSSNCRGCGDIDRLPCHSMPQCNVQSGETDRGFPVMSAVCQATLDGSAPRFLSSSPVQSVRGVPADSIDEDEEGDEQVASMAANFAGSVTSLACFSGLEAAGLHDANSQPWHSSQSLHGSEWLVDPQHEEHDRQSSSVGVTSSLSLRYTSDIARPPSCESFLDSEAAFYGDLFSHSSSPDSECRVWRQAAVCPAMNSLSIQVSLLIQSFVCLCVPTGSMYVFLLCCRGIVQQDIYRLCDRLTPLARSIGLSYPWNIIRWLCCVVKNWPMVIKIGFCCDTIYAASPPLSQSYSIHKFNANFWMQAILSQSICIFFHIDGVLSVQLLITQIQLFVVWWYCLKLMVAKFALTFWESH